MAVRVLIIEDNSANLELMAYLLQASGYETLAANDGLHGLLTAEREKPDLIVCDIQMPGMDGYEFARHFRNNPALRRIPLVAVTALAMVGDREKVLAAGFDGYLAKPIVPETFGQDLAKFLPADMQRSTTPPPSTGSRGNPG